MIGRTTLSVEGRHVGPVHLDEVAGRVAEIELHAAVGQLHDRVAEGVVEDAEVLGAEEDALEVVDVEGEVLVCRRRLVGIAALEHVQLHLAHSQVLRGRVEVVRRDSLETEHVLVEADRPLELAGPDRDVVEAGGGHGVSLDHLLRSWPACSRALSSG